jgi:hypothetical protein
MPLEAASPTRDKVWVGADIRERRLRAGALQRLVGAPQSRSVPTLDDFAIICFAASFSIELRSQQ